MKKHGCEANALLRKLAEVRNKAALLDRRFKPMPPAKLAWVHVVVYAGGTTSIPSGHIWSGEPQPVCVTYALVVEKALDQIARSFCALEDYGQWLDRVKAGEEKHKQELVRQVSAQVTRLQTYAVFTGGDKP